MWQSVYLVAFFGRPFIIRSSVEQRTHIAFVHCCNKVSSFILDLVTSGAVMERKNFRVSGKPYQHVLRALFKVKVLRWIPSREESSLTEVRTVQNCTHFYISKRKIGSIFHLAKVDAIHVTIFSNKQLPRWWGTPCAATFPRELLYLFYTEK